MIRTGIIHLLPPYYEKSWTKRIVKTPKVYFFDTGIACYLLGIDSQETLAKSFLKGRLFETLVINEIRKTHENEGNKINFYYYRDYHQNEIDLVYIQKGQIYGIECKFKEKHTNVFSNFKELNDSAYPNNKNAIICNVQELSALSEKILIVPVKSI